MASAESLIEWVETKVTQQRDLKGNLVGYLISADEWRQMRSTIRRIAATAATQEAPEGGEAPCEPDAWGMCQRYSHDHSGATEGGEGEQNCGCLWYGKSRVSACSKHIADAKWTRP